MLPPLSALRCFHIASRCENFAAAADVLCITPSAVSHQIKTLETFIGVPLFIRSQRGMQLSAAGKVYADRIGPVFQEIKQATQEIIQSKEHLRLVVQVPPSLASSWLVPRLASFVRRHRSIEIQVLTNIGSDAKTAHCEIRYGHGKWPNAQPHLLWTEKLRPIVAPGGPQIRQPSDLANATLIHTRSRSRGWKDFFDACGIHETAESGLYFDRTGLALEAAAAGLGVALESPLLARRFLDGGQLSTPLDGVEIDDEAYYFVDSLGEISEGAAHFKSWLLEQLPPELSRG